MADGFLFAREGALSTLRYGETNGVEGINTNDDDKTFVFHIGVATPTDPRVFRAFIGCNETQDGVAVGTNKNKVADTIAGAVDALPLFDPNPAP